jgi:hypothetical protein
MRKPTNPSISSPTPSSKSSSTDSLIPISGISRLPLLGQEWLKGMADLQKLAKKGRNRRRNMLERELEGPLPRIAPEVKAAAGLAKQVYDSEMERAATAIKTGRIEPGNFKVVRKR